jgi:NAD(P)-dependent dehydrogenase (short-subunit alcohol dehydrogenase family)
MVALTLADSGADVRIVARERDDLDRTANEIARRSGRVITSTAADVSTPEGCQAVVEAVGDGPLDVLVNNAGGTTTVPVLELTDDELDAAIAVNLISVMRLCRDLVPVMNDRGRIVNIGSIAAREPHPNTAHYAAAKAGVVAYSKALSVAVGRRGITVNVILPGFTLTPGSEREVAAAAARTGLPTSTVRERINGPRQALRRPGTVEEVAAAVAFLASDAAAGITGTALPVDGGALQGVW